MAEQVSPPEGLPESFNLYPLTLTWDGIDSYIGHQQGGGPICMARLLPVGVIRWEVTFCLTDPDGQTIMAYSCKTPDVLPLNALVDGIQTCDRLVSHLPAPVEQPPAITPNNGPGPA